MDPAVWLLAPLAGLGLYVLVWWLRGYGAFFDEELEEILGDGAAPGGPGDATVHARPPIIRP